MVLKRYCDRCTQMIPDGKKRIEVEIGFRRNEDAEYQRIQLEVVCLECARWAGYPLGLMN